MNTNTNTKTRTRNAIINDIVKHFKRHDEIFADALEELDAYNDYLGDDRYYTMDELDEFYNGKEPTEILQRAFFGYDADTWTADSNGDKDYGQFNPMRDYFYFNGYGNLVSTDYKDYSDYNDAYAVESMAENRAYIDTIDGDDALRELFDELEALDADDE